MGEGGVRLTSRALSTLGKLDQTQCVSPASSRIGRKFGMQIGVHMGCQNVGDYEMIANFSQGGMSYERAYAQMERFANKVMPKLKV